MRAPGSSRQSVTKPRRQPGVQRADVGERVPDLGGRAIDDDLAMNGSHGALLLHVCDGRSVARGRWAPPADSGHVHPARRGPRRARRLAAVPDDRALADEFDLKRLPDGFYDDPYPTYRALREHAPVKRLADGGVFLSRYADVVAVYKDTATFSSDKHEEFSPKYGASPLFEHHTTSLVFNDPPLHTRVRRLIAGALTPRHIAAMEPRLVERVDDLLDAIAARGARRRDRSHRAPSRARSRSRSSATCWRCRTRSGRRCATGRWRSSARSSRR